MAVSPVVIKAIITAATDKRTWKAVVVLITAVLMPIIIVILRHHRTTLSKLWSNYDDVKNGADLPNFVRRAH